MSYVELHAHSSYSFLDGASLPEELARGAAELGYQRARAHRPRRHLRLAGVRARGEGVRRPRDHRRRGDARGRRARDAARRDARGYANLCRLLTAAHGDAPRPEDRRSPCAPACAPRGAQRGLVCLSGCAPRGLGSSTRTARRASPRAFGRERFFVELSGRSSAATCAGTPRCASSQRRSACRPSRRATCTRTTAPRSSRTSSSRSATHLARRLRARAAGNQKRCCSAADEVARALPRRPGRRRARRRARGAPALRPHRRPRLPLSRLRRRRARERRRCARRVCDAEFASRYEASNSVLLARPAAARRGAGADRRLGLAASSCSTTRCSSSPPRSPREVRGGDSPRHVPPAGPRPRELRRLDRLLPDRPLPRRPGQGRPLARPLPERRDARPSPTSTSTSRATSARS